VAAAAQLSISDVRMLYHRRGVDLHVTNGYTDAMHGLCRTGGVVGLLLLSSVALRSAPPSLIQSITVRGNEHISSRELLGLMSSKTSLPFSPAILLSDMRVVADAYRVRGYLGARATAAGPQFSNDSAWVDITIDVAEGRPTVLAALEFRSLRPSSPAVEPELLATRAGNPFEPVALEQDIESLLARYETMGYPCALIRVDTIGLRRGPDVDSLAVMLTIDEGERMTIDEIRVQGNKETQAEVVVRETRLSAGDPYDPAKVNAIRQRLRRLNIFTDVAEPELYVRGKKGGLLLRVTEGNTNTFDGVIGYVPPPSSAEKGYVTGLVSATMRNLFGTGRRVSVRWLREDRLSQELSTRYLEPWVASLPLNAGIGFFQRQQDTAYVRRIVDGNVELMLSDELSIGLLASVENIIPSADTTVRRATRSSTTTIGAEILYDTRDDIVVPSAGARYHTDYRYGRRRGSGGPVSAGQISVDGTVQRFGVDLEFYVPVQRLQVLAFGIHGREIRSGHVEEAEMYRFGGTNSLRGYRENEFLGSRIAWTNAEYRYLLGRRSFLFGFIDTGYYSRSADATRSIPAGEAFKYGFGIGLRVDTALGNMGVSFALGQGDSFGQGKIHFGLLNEF
jgi:outer membrane protein assembly factor BamA